MDSFGAVKNDSKRTYVQPGFIKQLLICQYCGVGLPAGVPRDHVSPLTPAEEDTLRAILIRAGVLEGNLAKTA